MENRRGNIHVTDSILDFDDSKSFSSLNNESELHFEKVVQFDSLPIAGWHDNNEISDSTCKQSCVKDCSCVSHCSWVIS
ncbi:MAG: hypothetical protein JW870_11880 [Candidatus Delongbacteria bacterium]|nr:hypothetical protein [Candidatus Delongbacteria bacterium]